MPTLALTCRPSGFHQGNVSPTAPFLITQKWGKDVVKGGAKRPHQCPYGDTGGKGGTTEWTRADFSRKSRHEGYGVCADADAPPLTIPPSETRRYYLAQLLGGLVNRTAPPPRISEAATEFPQNRSCHNPNENTSLFNCTPGICAPVVQPCDFYCMIGESAPGRDDSVYAVAQIAN